MRRNNEGLDTCLESRMNDGAKAGLWLVGSELSFPSFFAWRTPLDHLRRRTSTLPEHPTSSKAAEVLACHSGLGLFDGTGREAPEQCIDDLLCRVGIIPY